MNIRPTNLPEVLLIEPRVFGDDRGCFYESYNQRQFRQNTGVQLAFVQDNHSASRKGVVRGLHYQIGQAQGKLVRVIKGEVFDVAVDLRRSSPNFGKVACATLSAENRCLLWIPPGFAHGFLTLSDEAEFLYKTTDYWAATAERTLLWNDSALGIDWPLQRLGQQSIVLSTKDLQGNPLASADTYP